MSPELPGDISKPEKIDPTKPLSSGEEKESPTKSFKDVMGKTESPTSTQESGKVSPMGLTESTPKVTGTPTTQSVIGQIDSASGVLGDISNQLNTKGLKLKPSHKYLLRNKLTEANTHIRTAAKKVGVNVGKSPSTISRQNPLTKFLAYVADSQEQLKETRNQITKISEQRGEVNPGQLLLVQVKLNAASQSLEYSSVLLSSATNDIKTLFNIQI